MNKKLVSELRFYSETHGPDTVLGRAFAKAAVGQVLTASELAVLLPELRAELNDRWHPACDWGGTSQPQVAVRNAVLKLVDQLQIQSTTS